MRTIIPEIKVRTNDDELIIYRSNEVIISDDVTYTIKPKQITISGCTFDYSTEVIVKKKYIVNNITIYQ